tara:strand:- start:18442 stop:18807 length:366 start_codon:yes stop_codon:yes gene_type:complete
MREVIANEDRLIGPTELSQMIGCSEDSVKNWMRDKMIPSVQIGQKRLMTQAQYKGWVKGLEKPKAKAKVKAAPMSEELNEIEKAELDTIEKTLTTLLDDVVSIAIPEEYPSIADNKAGDPF